MSPERSDKSRGVALALAIVLGPFGAHRFYAGRVQSGTLMALTFGGAGLWWLYDLVMIVAGEFEDVNGRVLADWESVPANLRAGGSPEILDELDTIRREVAELHERMDFAERLLSAPSRGGGEATRGD